MRSLSPCIVTRLLLGIVLVANEAAACAQPAAPPTKHVHQSIQETPGEGDAGEADAVDEAADAKPHPGPYTSPYKLTFRAPAKELLFDAGQPRGSVAAQSSVPLAEPVHRLRVSAPPRARLGSA